MISAGCGGQDGTPDHHPPLPRQHLQRRQQQLPQCQGDCRIRVIHKLSEYCTVMSTRVFTGLHI